MIEGIEVQLISKLLTTESNDDIDALLSYDDSYFRAYIKEVQYIRDHYQKHHIVPSVFDFKLNFPDFVVVNTKESVEYIHSRMIEYRRFLLLNETFNKLKDLGDGDVNDAWKYLSIQCDVADKIGSSDKPMDIVADSKERAQRIIDFNSQSRIPTGFPEIDRAMYGGLSTVEELLVLIARTNSGKSWICSKMMESAQKNGFPVAYYSPEMQAAFLATRFDTWREHFENSNLHRGIYSDQYRQYIDDLAKQETPAYIIEDKDYPDGVSVRSLSPFIKKYGIKLLIIDGISYMTDDEHATRDQEKYKHIATGLFSLSKKYGCAVVLVMQANREVKSKDDKGESIPDLYNAEGSDHPGRVATQAFGIRQIFDKHVLDIKLLKSRSANNQNPVFSYSWDINTGNMSYIPPDNDDDFEPGEPQSADYGVSISSTISTSSSQEAIVYDDDDDIEF